MKVAILGAGVAGVSTAIALRQCGLEVSVHEARPRAGHIGAGIVAWPNAVFVLEQLGVRPQIEAVSGRPTRMQRLSSTGEDLGALDITAIDRLMGRPSLSLLRRDLQRILLERLSALGVTVQYGQAVQGFQANGRGQVQALLSDGRRLEADVLVGAEGRMASPARHHVLGHNTPVFQGFVNWIGVCEAPGPWFQDPAVLDVWGVGERVGLVPVTPRIAYWAAGAAVDAIGPRDPARYHADLQARFGHWPAPLAQVMAHTPAAQIHLVHVHDHDPARRWHRDNLIAIGDAAHAPLPTSGQGACQALEDAWHLARCLVDSPHDVPAAFERFTALRYDKTTGIIQVGRGMATSLFHRDPAYCAQRNAASRRTDFAATAAAMARGWAQQLPLAA